MREEDDSCDFAERRASFEREWYLVWERQEKKEAALRWSVLEFVFGSNGNQKNTSVVVERR